MWFSKAPLHSSFISFQVTPRMMNNMSFEVIHSPPQQRASSWEIQFCFWGQNWKINCWWCTHWWKCRSVVGAKAKLSNELFLLPPHPPLTKACAGQARCQTDFLSHLKSKSILYIQYIYIISITIMAVICKGSSYNGGDNTRDWEHSAGF